MTKKKDALKNKTADRPSEPVIKIKKDEKAPVVEKKEDMKKLLEAYKKLNPVKYEAKLKAGQFDKFLK